MNVCTIEQGVALLEQLLQVKPLGKIDRLLACLDAIRTGDRLCRSQIENPGACDAALRELAKAIDDVGVPDDRPAAPSFWDEGTVLCCQELINGLAGVVWAGLANAREGSLDRPDGRVRVPISSTSAGSPAGPDPRHVSTTLSRYDVPPRLSPATEPPAPRKLASAALALPLGVSPPQADRADLPVVRPALGHLFDPREQTRVAGYARQVFETLERLRPVISRLQAAMQT
jgi:hypothetical protein